MNLSKLFEMQAELDKHIEKEHPRTENENRLNKKVLALLVELGELANEWRGFKFWSKDQEPRTKVPVTLWGAPFKNPLLEEYVDCLHFILTIGLERGFNEYFDDEVNFNIGSRTKQTNPADSFTDCFIAVSNFAIKQNEGNYFEVVFWFTTLADSLGFTEEQIERAYIDKNKVNHQRQESGY